MNLDKNSSVLGRLLEELSWVGSTIESYRTGGRGFENVLTAEVFQALDFLPRQAFLGAIIEASQGATKARALLVQEIEQAEFTLLPGNHYLIPSATRHQTRLAVQPDGLIQSPSCYVLLEAKRMKRSSFQPQQLAREFVLVMREARKRQPLLWLVLGSEPPVLVQGHGRLELSEAIELYLESVLARAENHNLEKTQLLEQMDEVVSWTTWQTIAQVVREQAKSIATSDPSIAACVGRLTDSVIRSVSWHS